MQVLKLIFSFAIMIILIYTGCHKENPEEKFIQFNREFFARHVPEFAGARLLTKQDIPEKQQSFFDEADGRLQLLLDMNNNDIPEYIICGVADSMLLHHEKNAYFIAMFEQTETGIKLQHLQSLLISPVNIKSSKNNVRPGLIISFAFFSDYAAEIYFENNKYHLEKWY